MTPDEFEAYLFEHSAALQARPFGSYERCPLCSCQWHGLPCIQQLPVPGGGGTAPCMCPGGQP